MLRMIFLPAVLSLQKVKLLLDPVNRLPDRQLEGGGLGALQGCPKLKKNTDEKLTQLSAVVATLRVQTFTANGYLWFCILYLLILAWKLAI